MKAQVAPESQDALGKNATLRCLFKTKYSGDRHSQEVIAWASIATHEVTEALASVIGQAASQLSVQLNSIVLSRDKAYICFDTFAEGCDEATLAEVNSSCEQPVHYIHKKADTIFVRREASMDTYVAGRYSQMRSIDSGPRPYFVDESNPPVYDRGVRVEGPRSKGSTDDDDAELVRSV